MLGYNSDAKAAEHAQQELQDQYGATVFCVKVRLLRICLLDIPVIKWSKEQGQRGRTIEPLPKRPTHTSFWKVPSNLASISRAWGTGGCGAEGRPAGHVWPAARAL